MDKEKNTELNYMEKAVEDAEITAMHPFGGYEESARIVRAKGWEWDHEVRLYLPPSYHSPESSGKVYPTLWVMDNYLEIAQAALTGAVSGYAPELIVVAVGAPKEIGAMAFSIRRYYDFLPEESLLGPSYKENNQPPTGGAAGFLDFLVNQLRPMLAKEYRMDLNDQGYAGHSGGGQFGLYTLFNKPESFHKYLIASPAISKPWLDMEAIWFEEHKDLNAKVFMSAGEREVDHPIFAVYAQVVSTVALISERLTTRNYPSLDLTVRIFPEESHMSVIPISYSRGIRTLWGKEGGWHLRKVY